jgi:hypothetical protein
LFLHCWGSRSTSGADRNRVDINPVQVAAKDMDTAMLKNEFRINLASGVVIPEGEPSARRRWSRRTGGRGPCPVICLTAVAQYSLGSLKKIQPNMKLLEIWQIILLSRDQT